MGLASCGSVRYGRSKYSIGNKCEFWQTEQDAMQGGECAAVRALQARANAAARRFWKPKTHLFLSEYLVVFIFNLAAPKANFPLNTLFPDINSAFRR